MSEREQLQQLDRLARQIGGLAPDQAGALEERRRVLHGLLRWRLSGEYAARLHRLRHGLAEVEAEIAEAESRKKQLVAALHTAPAGQQQFAARLDAMMPRVAAMQARIALTLEHTDRRLVDLATGELEQRRQRLAQYLDQARYALAAIHDRAAAEGS